MIVSVVLLLKSTLQGVTDTPFVQVMVESNDSAHTGGTNINALVNTEVARSCQQRLTIVLWLGRNDLINRHTTRPSCSGEGGIGTINNFVHQLELAKPFVVFDWGDMNANLREREESLFGGIWC